MAAQCMRPARPEGQELLPVRLPMVSVVARHSTSAQPGLGAKGCWRCGCQCSRGPLAVQGGGHASGRFRQQRETSRPAKPGRTEVDQVDPSRMRLPEAPGAPRLGRTSSAEHAGAGPVPRARPACARREDRVDETWAGRWRGGHAFVRREVRTRAARQLQGRVPALTVLPAELRRLIVLSAKSAAAVKNKQWKALPASACKL